MSESSGSTEPEPRVERAVEDLISEAATLADDLSDEVSGDEAAARETTDRERRFFESHATSEPDLEAQLSTAADQVADASSQLGGGESAPSDADAPSEPSTPPPESNSPPSGDECESADVSLFAADPSPSANRKTTKKLVLPPKRPKKSQDAAETDDGNVAAEETSAKVDSVTEEAVSLEGADLTDIGDGAPKTGAPQSASSTPAKPSAATLTDSPALAWLAAMLNGPALVLARALEVIDRPFARFGPATRMMLGWLAMFIFVAAFFLLIFFVF